MAIDRGPQRPLRNCRWCRHPLVKPGTNTGSSRLRQAHCGNPACTWCAHCVQIRSAAIAAGRLDLLEPESDVERTREIPAVTDGEPPDIDPTDQMT